MGVAIVHSRALAGLEAPRVDVEVHLANGLPAFGLVGLPEAEVREARERVRAALQNAQFEFPQRRITVNLAPADLPKESGRFDLPIAIGILVATGQLPADAIARHEFAGELALTGELRPIRGALAMVLSARREGRAFVLPQACAAEAALVPGAAVHAARSLLDVCAHLAGRTPLPALARPQELATPVHADLADVRGQAHARRALEVAAAGGHSVLMIGPPGTGKSMLAQRLPGVLPPLGEDDALDSAALASLAGRFDPRRWRDRPFRAPHHTASAVALIGGGSHPRPGEVSLAHHGVLFLDELPEWDRRVLEALREPLESGVVHVSRAARQCTFPAAFQLVAAMNPCPCGWLGDERGRCRCSPDRIARYRTRVSGPLVDRIDLWLEVPSLPPDALASDVKPAEPSERVRERVVAAAARQRERQGCANARLSPPALALHGRMEPAAEALLHRAMRALGLSARSFDRLRKVARTVADLAGAPAIEAPHVAEAIGYRRLETVGSPAVAPAAIA